MPYKEKETAKLYYTIGEVSKMFNVNASLIRFWEKEFNIIKLQKNKKGNRLFTQQDIATFQTIYRLVKERGFTLQGAKTSLKEGKNDVSPDLSLKDTQAEILQTLANIREQLLELKNQL